MAIKSYKYNDTSKLSEHFRVNEFKCKCGKNHDIKIDTNLVPLLEKVRSKLNASSCVIYSGYRCPSHNKAIGSSSSGNYSHSGYAVDCYFLDQNRKRIPSSKVCLALEDLGHKGGIGYRCGGSKDSTGNTHIDVKPRKWYGDESKSMSATCCTSYYKYFGIKKEVEIQVKEEPKLKMIAHIQDIGWASWNDRMVGTVGQSKRIEAIKIDSAEPIEAKAHIQNIGWKDYGKIIKDTVIGTTGESRAIECLCLKGNFEYRVHIQNFGWSPWTKADGIATLGTVGQSLSIEAIEFR